MRIVQPRGPRGREELALVSQDALRVRAACRFRGRCRCVRGAVVRVDVVRDRLDPQVVGGEIAESDVDTERGRRAEFSRRLDVVDSDVRSRGGWARQSSSAPNMASAIRRVSASVARPTARPADRRSDLSLWTFRSERPEQTHQLQHVHIGTTGTSPD